MTSNNELYSPSVPYEEGLHSRLLDPSYAGLFIAAALENEQEQAGALETSLGHVICAWAKKDPGVAILVISLTIHHLNADTLRRLTKLLEDRVTLETRKQLRFSSDFISGFSELADILEEGGTVEFMGIENTKPMAEAEKAFKEYAA